MPILRSIFGQETTSEDLGLTFTIRLTKGRRGQTAVSRLLARPQLTLRPTMGAFYVGQTVCVSPGEPLGETLLFVFITERGNSTSRKASLFYFYILFFSDIHGSASGKAASNIPLQDQHLALAILLELAVQRGTLRYSEYCYI